MSKRERPSSAPSAPADAAPPARRRRRRRKDERGVALVMVLGAITVLTVFLTELQEDTTSTLSAALAERDAVRAEYYARSAVNLGRLVIAAEPTMRASLGPILMMLFKTASPPQLPVWRFTDLMLGPFNQIAPGAPAFGGMTGVDPATGKNLGMPGGGRWELNIVDEDSKINVNAGGANPVSQLRLATQLMGLMAPQQYNPLFEGRDVDNQFSDRQAICSAIVDWTDPDETLFPCDLTANAQSTGIEDNFYQTIGLDYRRKNAPFDSLEELRLVRGVGDDFWATFIDPDPGDPTKRPFTVWGQGRVNVRSAAPQTMLALVCGNAVPETELCNNPVQMMTFLSVVGMIQGFLGGVLPVGSPSDFVAMMNGKSQMFGQIMQGLGIKPVVFRSETEFKKLLAADSKRFSIYADGIVPGYKRQTRVRIHAVVDFRPALPPGAAVPGIFSPNAQTAGGPGGGGALAGMAGLAGASRAGGGTVAPPSGGNNALPSAATPDAIIGMLQSNPAGNIVYWRVE